MSHDELLARLITLECERDCYVREINALRQLCPHPRIPVTGAVIDALRLGKKTSRDVSTCSGIARKSVQTMLSELKKMGIVESKPVRRGRNGRPEHVYALRAA